MRITRWGGRAAAIALLVLLAAPAVPGAAGTRVLAHAQLVTSSPAAGTVLDTSPDELRLIFSEPLEAELTSLDVVGQDGTALLSHAGSVDPDDPYALVVADPNLPDGIYSLSWRTLSAADGHSAEGFFTFGIGADPGTMPVSPVGGTTHDERDLLSMIGRWLTYLGLLLALGVAVFHRVVLHGPMPRRLTLLLAASFAVTVVATLTIAGLSAIESGEPRGYLLARNGLLQLARGGVALIGVIALLVVGGRAAGAVAAALGLAGIVLLVTAGHASAVVGPAAMAAGIVHVVAAATWIGGLAGLLLLAYRPNMVVEGTPPRLRDAVPRFSAIALVSIGAVALTGIYSAWVQTGSLLPVGTEYGRTLVLKSVAVIGAIAVGALSYFEGDRIRRWLGDLRDRLNIEISLVAVVLALTAALAFTPPIEDVRGVSITPIPDAFGNVAPDMRLQIAPGRPGVNRVIVTTTDALAAVGGLDLTLDRIDTGESSRVPLTLSGAEGMAGMPGMDHSGMADRNADGTVDWYADAIVLPAGSSWDSSVHVVSSAGLELSRQRFAFTLDEGGIADGRLTSLLTPGSVIALICLIGGALALGLGLGGMALPRCDPRASRIALIGSGTTAVVLGLVIGVSGLVLG